MSARNSSQAFDLRCDVREAMLEFIRNNYPEGLPKQRIEFSDRKDVGPSMPFPS
jgi:hypothetical protein